MSCEHPIRVFNKYTQEYVWTPCGKCNSCKNRRAMMFTEACERERSVSKFTMFVTLTYSETALPVYNFTGGFDSVDDLANFKYTGCLISSRERDLEVLEVNNDLFDEQSDRDLFEYFLTNKGIPYASKSDIQLFHKRLNKWFFNNVTHKYQNFRFFLVSELGSTTLRPHFHSLYFVNDSEVARRFEEGVLSCWKYGRTDTQYVENSACSYVAQYINKLSDLPSFYKACAIRPFYLASRNPFIGNLHKYAQSDEEIFHGSVVQTFTCGKKDSQPVLSQLDKSIENRLFPKCYGFKSLSDPLRVELYSISSRFASKSFRGFQERIRHFLYGQDKYDNLEICGIGYSEYINTLSCYDVSFKMSDLYFLLKKMVDGFSEVGINWLRRTYYLSRKVINNALRFGVSIFAYVQKIDEYYSKKELYLLKLMYNFQSEYLSHEENDLYDIQLMYPEYLRINGFTLGDILKEYCPDDVRVMHQDAAHFAYSNKITHYKNIYLEALRLKNNSFFVQLKKFYHAKKRYEISEALTA